MFCHLIEIFVKIIINSMKYSFVFLNIVLVISLALIITKYFHSIINPFIEDIEDMFDNRFHNIRATSVWCQGLNHSQRRCRFVNLCYKRDTEDYLFINDDKLSIKSGIPKNRFAPALLDMSSVNNHNQFYFNYIEIPLKVLNILSKNYSIVTQRGKTLIMSRFKTDNLMHYFVDDLMPLYFTLQDIGSKEIDFIFLDDIYSQSLHKPFRQTIFESIFPKSYDKNQFNDKTIYCFQHSFIGLSKAMVWYDYGFLSPQSPLNISKDESKLITKTIHNFINDLLISRKCDQKYVIFISREFNRKILNEKQLIDFITKYTKLFVIKVDNFNQHFEQIIEKVFCAQLLIGMHGSGLILSMFLSPGSGVIELFPYAINPNHLTPYKTLTQMNEMNVKYFYWKNQFINNTFTHKEYDQQFGGLQDLSQGERHKIMSATEEVPKHLCCSDRYWLYRIYQDTVVDINSFKPILDKALEKTSEVIEETKESIEPGFVSNSRCDSIIKDNKHMILIVWKKPWILDVIENNEIEVKYEVLIQEVPSLSAKSLITEKHELIFESKPNKVHNIWIRCKLNHTFGPFSKNPLIC